MKRMMIAVGAALLVGSVGVTTPLASAAASETSWAFSDAQRDAEPNPSLTRGPAFTSRIAPQAADIRSVSVVLTADVLYVRVNLRDVYGAGRVADRQEGAQYVGVEVSDPSGGRMASATVTWRVGAPTTYFIQSGYIGENECGRGLFGSHFTASATENYVLLRIPATCIDRLEGPSDIGRTSVWAGQVITRRDARGAVVSTQAWVDGARHSAPAA